MSNSFLYSHLPEHFVRRKFAVVELTIFRFQWTPPWHFAHFERLQARLRVPSTGFTPCHRARPSPDVGNDLETGKLRCADNGSRAASTQVRLVCSLMRILDTNKMNNRAAEVKIFFYCALKQYRPRSSGFIDTLQVHNCSICAPDAVMCCATLISEGYRIKLTWNRLYQAFSRINFQQFIMQSTMLRYDRTGRTHATACVVALLISKSNIWTVSID